MKILFQILYKKEIDPKLIIKKDENKLNNE